MSTQTDFIKAINMTWGENTAVILDDMKSDVDFISTGVMGVDDAFGGGIPRGRMTEVFGKEGIGKTSLCLQTIAQAQKNGLLCGFIDTEHATSPQRMKMLGVDTSQLVFSQPNSGELALEIVLGMANAGFGLVVVDSVASIVPQKEFEGDMGDSPMASQARLMSQAMRKLAGPVAKNNTALLFTNQLRSTIAMYGPTKVTPGGAALRYYASLRVELKHKSTNKDSDGVYGLSGELVVVKNKVASPFKTCLFTVDEYGINTAIEDIKELIKSGEIVKSGAWFEYDGQKLQGKKALIDYYRTKLV